MRPKKKIKTSRVGEKLYCEDESCLSLTNLHSQHHSKLITWEFYPLARTVWLEMQYLLSRGILTEADHWVDSVYKSVTRWHWQCKWLVTDDTGNVPHDMCHVIPDTWHMTLKRRKNHIPFCPFWAPVCGIFISDIKLNAAIFI